MATTYGYFDSVSGDRKYTAAQMSQYFKGLVSDGVYADIGDGLQVVAASGMDVIVKPGRAILDCRWIENDANATITIPAASSQFNRWTAVILRLDYSGRQITITTKNGTPATTPTQPTMQRDGTYYELCLAMIYVAKGATSISQLNITDMRTDSSVCGWVTGLIQQVDTSTLFIQWQNAYQAFYESFQEWFDTLTSTLNVNTYITEFTQVVTGTQTECSSFDISIGGYVFDVNDVFILYINGLAARPGTDYTISETGHVTVNMSATAALDNKVLLRILKSRIGNPPSGGNSFGPLTITENDTVNSDITVTDGE